MNADSILIIGASSAIGREVIRLVSNENTIVLAHFHTHRNALDDLQAEVKSRLIPIQADLMTEAGVDSLIEAVERETPPRKILFLAAPPLALVRFKDLAWKDFQVHLDFQVRAVVKILGRFLPEMATARSGRVVFMLTSLTMGVPSGALAHYVTGKYALLGLMKALAAEYAGKKVCINAVSPSMIATDYIANFPEKLVELTAQQHPRRQNALPGEIAPVIAFLLSDAAGYLTGANIPVTGGAQF